MFGVLAALTVVSTPELECPDRAAVLRRLDAVGVVVRDEDEIAVHFSSDATKMVAEIRLPDAAPRRIEHEGHDCASLGDATIALLSVLLDERTSAPKSPPPPPSKSERRDERSPPLRVRIDGGVIAANGIVAPLGAGATLGAGWLAAPWASLGVSGDLWPGREHAIREGMVTVNAWTLALTGCAGPRGRHLALEGCALGHVGRYELGARNFPVVRPATRALFGVEAALRVGVHITDALAIFARAGLWIPFTRLDVTVRGADSAFSTSNLAAKGALGIEYRL
jgi:hypothetical protein